MAVTKNNIKLFTKTELKSPTAKRHTHPCLYNKAVNNTMIGVRGGRDLPKQQIAKTLLDTLELQFVKCKLYAT